MSFQTACYRLGINTLLLDTAGGTSLEKGESIEDSILNIAAMGPDVLIIRAPDSLELSRIEKTLPCPVINAGWGVCGHPSQALLDAYTLRERWGHFQGKKLLLVGDIKHSRVAASHFELAPILGMELGICGPNEFLGNPPSHVQIFDDLKKAADWSDAIMMLRFQFERHAQQGNFSKESISAAFGLNSRTLGFLRPDHLIMHPGPINHGIEMDEMAIQDSRSVILEQVNRGTWVRQALLLSVLQPKAVF